MSHAFSKRERIEEAEVLLQNSREGLTVFDIAEKLDCHPSTVHRYFEEIRSTRDLIEGKRGHYRLDPAESLSNVRLRPAEALTIYLALRRFIRQTNKAPDFMISAIQKVIPALQRPDLIEQLTRSNEQLHVERGADEKFEQIWETLIQAWLENIVVHIHYRGARATKLTEHDIEPQLFEPMPLGDGIYVIARSQQRQARRTFKLDRIERAMLTVQRFERSSTDINSLLHKAWGIWYGEEQLTQVELIFKPTVARRLMESIFLPRELKTLLPDGSLCWKAEVNGVLEILSWVQSWGDEVRVIAPETLRVQVINDLRSTLALYEGGD